jgi:O-antigen ligase
VIVVFVLAEVLLLAGGFALDQPLLGAALAAALVFLIIAYRHPAAAWLLVWLASPFSVETRIPGGHALYLPAEPMIALALLAWGCRALERGSLRIPRSGLHAPLAALAAAALLSALFSPFASLGIKAWVAAAGYVAFGYLYWFLNPREAADLKRWAPWVVGFSALWGLYGTVRVLAEGVSLRHAYGAARPFFTEHGAYGAYLAMTLPLALLLTVERRGRAQALYAAASLAITLGILFSLTRAAWVSLALVLPLTAVLWAWWRRRALKPLAVVAALGATVLIVLWGSGSGERLSRHAESIIHAGDVSNLERVNRWMAATEMVRDRPVLGVGLAAYPGMYPVYRRKLVLTELAYQHMGPHSELFRLLSEMGIVGFLAAAWFLGAAAILGFRVFRRSADPRARLLSLALLAGLGTYVVHALFRTYLDLEKVAIPFWASLGMIAAMGREFQEAGARPSIRVSPGETSAA